jgi:predicted negative regulator of RcsB-dependent stress response
MFYETEEQQVEALKNWWQENGRAVVAGAVLGLAGVFGWRAWLAHQNTVAAQASNLFDQLVMSVESGKPPLETQQQTITLRDEYGATPYAAFADLMAARIRYEQGDVAGTKAALEQAIVKAPDPALQILAVLRLARVKISAGELDQAMALLNQYPAPPSFIAEYAVLRGDIARAKGDAAAARSAYQEALAGKPGQADLIQLKLDNLPSLGDHPKS